MRVDSKPHILVADDEELMRSLLAEILSPEFRITAVENGAEALAVLETGVPLNGMITDFEMGDLDGVDLIERVLAQHQTLQVILLTANPWATKIRLLSGNRRVLIVEKMPSIREFVRLAGEQFSG